MSAIPAMPDEIFDVFGEMGEIAIVMLIALLAFYLVAMVVAIVMYVLQSVGVYTIAKRRGIHHPWLAWIPIGNVWIWGSISDQYQYVTKGKIRNRRKVLLGLDIALIAMSIPMFAVEIAMFAVMGDSLASGVGAAVAFAVIWLIYMVLGITTTVFMYIAQYDIYKSCDPNNAVTYLILGIFFNFLQSIFLFVCRKKDLGMPPRKQPAPAAVEAPEQVVVTEPEAETEEAAAEEAEPEVQNAEPCTAEETDFADEPTETEDKRTGVP